MTILTSVKILTKFTSSVLVSWSSKLGVNVTPPQAPPPSGDYVSSVVVGSSYESEYSVPYPSEITMRSSIVLSSLSAVSPYIATSFISRIETSSTPSVRVPIDVDLRSLIDLGSSHVIRYMVKEIPEEVIIFPKTIDVDDYVHYPYFPMLSRTTSDSLSPARPFRLVEITPVEHFVIASSVTYQPESSEVTFEVYVYTQNTVPQGQVCISDSTI